MQTMITIGFSFWSNEDIAGLSSPILLVMSHLIETRIVYVTYSINDNWGKSNTRSKNKYSFHIAF